MAILVETIGDRLKRRRDEVLAIAEAHGARNVRVLGSVARGGERDERDLDLLVEMEPGRSLLDMGRLLINLQDLLGCRVQIAEPEGLHWYVKKKVLEEAVPL